VWYSLTTSSSDSPSIPHVEDLCGMLQPIEVSGNFLDDVAFASGRKADHDDDKLCPNIALGYSSVW
jgi:hypothetical protein